MRGSALRVALLVWVAAMLSPAFPIAEAQTVAGGEALLESIAKALAGARVWQAEFTQRYVPSGFDTGATDHGRLMLAPPASLRFDYEGESPRVFASDGAVARYVDPGAMTCTALRLDATTWGRLPLAVILDPGAARAAFDIQGWGTELTLVPREPTPELGRVDVVAGRDHLPSRVTVVDASGNRNEFSFSRWIPEEHVADGLFRPSLPGSPPCVPAEE